MTMTLLYWLAIIIIIAGVIACLFIVGLWSIENKVQQATQIERKKQEALFELEREAWEKERKQLEFSREFIKCQEQGLEDLKAQHWAQYSQKEKELKNKEEFVKDCYQKACLKADDAIAKIKAMEKRLSQTQSELHRAREKNKRLQARLLGSPKEI